MADELSLSVLAAKKIDDVLAALKTSAKGLTQAQAAERLKIYGLNEFAGKKKLRPLFIFFSKFRNPLLLLLIAAAVISGVLGSHIEAMIILAIVFGGCVIVTIFLDQVVMPAWVHSQPMVVMPDCIGKNARDAFAAWVDRMLAK